MRGDLSGNRLGETEVETGTDGDGRRYSEKTNSLFTEVEVVMMMVWRET